jgi:anti-sigma factor RsiW
LESVATNLNHPSTAAGLALHAIGADDPAEREAVEAHLADCEACRQEMARLRDAASLLAPVDRRDLDGCWERIASRVRAD